jgi:hypothetical protein
MFIHRSTLFAFVLALGSGPVALAQVQQQGGDLPDTSQPPGSDVGGGQGSAQPESGGTTGGYGSGNEGGAGSAAGSDMNVPGTTEPNPNEPGSAAGSDMNAPDTTNPNPSPSTPGSTPGSAPTGGEHSDYGTPASPR